MKIRSSEVDGKKIAIIDEAAPLEVIEDEFQKLQKSTFTRTEYARAGKENYRHWVREMPVSDCMSGPLWQPSCQAVQHVFGSTPKQPLRSYTNFAAYGDMLFAHTDCPQSQRELTVLWYICPIWETDWGGETLFFDERGDAAFVSSPRPRRLVLFDGRLLHVGLPPNRTCEMPRYTFAIKIRG